MFDFTFNAPISLFIAVSALAGVAVHDTKIDKLATTFVGVPALISSTDGANKLASDPHTHVERVSIENSSQPRLAPRLGDQKKHVLQKNVPKGAHSFDGYNIHLANLE